MSKHSINIIIAGIGSQGVYTLSSVLQFLSIQAGFITQSAIYKGGAQSLGSIMTMLRLYVPKTHLSENDISPHHYSADIPPNSLDLMLALEPWEALRYHTYFTKSTTVFTSNQVNNISLETNEKYASKNPIECLSQLNIQLIQKPYQQIAQATFKHSKMANYALGLDVIQAQKLPFSTTDFARAFEEKVKMKGF